MEAEAGHREVVVVVEEPVLQPQPPVRALLGPSVEPIRVLRTQVKSLGLLTVLAKVDALVYNEKQNEVIFVKYLD